MADVTVVEQPPPRDYHPLAIIAQAVERGVDASQLERLLELQKSWEAHTASKAYNDAMSSCQSEMPVVVRDAENKGTHSRYARRETVLNTIKPCYTKHGFSLSFRQDDCPIPDHLRIVCAVRHRAGHTEHHHADLPLDGRGAKGGASAMNATQAVGSTYSYGCRYLTYLIFNVTVADEDDDGRAAGGAHITPDQVQEINVLFEECENYGKPVNSKKFYEWLGIEGLHELNQRDLPKVLTELNRKRRLAVKESAK